MFSRLPGKVSRRDVDFVKCKQKVFRLSGKVVFICDKNYFGNRDNFCPGPYTEEGQQGQLPPPPEKIKLAIVILL